MKMILLIIMLIFGANSQILWAQITSDAPVTYEQYLITGKIIDRQIIRGTNYAPTIIQTNENGTMRMKVFSPPHFSQIVIADYKVYRVGIAGRTFFSTNVPVTKLAVIFKILADTKPDWKPCIIFAEPYSLPDDVIQNNNLQGATIFQVKGIFKEVSEYDSILQKYGIKPEAILEAQVRLQPEALKVSPGVLTAFVRLPADYPVSGITSATCDGALSERMMLSDDGSEMIVKFHRQDIEKALAQIGQSLDTSFIVRGTWQGPAGTRLFQGTASIKKIISEK